MKIASWNVNSIRARLDRLLAWLSDRRPDVLCLQETKVVDDSFPKEALKDAGYQSLAFGQKTYNGVAILSRSRTPLVEVARGFGDPAGDLGARFLAAQVALEGSGWDGPIQVASVYVPNGREVGSPHFQEKLAWLAGLRTYLAANHRPEQPLVLCGDWNVAPEDRDVWDPDLLRDRIHCHPDERAALAELVDWGLVDTFRLHDPSPGRFSWWDYRQLGFPKNRGLRIDLILATAPLAERCVAASIDREARKGKGASDHAPVLMEVGPAQE